MRTRLLTLLMLFSQYAFGEQGAALKPAQPLVPGHSAATASAEIRVHHLKRAHARLTQDAEDLHRSCRYESDIATAPPHNKVVLSFDDGPAPGHTEFILDVLARHGVPGSFFLIGEKAQAHGELVSRIQAQGIHTVGNHSWSHPNFHDLDAAKQADEVLKFEPAPATGPVQRLFRYPYGNSSCETNLLLHNKGYRIAGWHVDSCDWAFDRNGTVDSKEALSCGVLPQNHANYVEHVVSTVRAHWGGIVLFHEIHAHTLAHLEEIILALKKDGFQFVSIQDPDFLPSLR